MLFCYFQDGSGSIDFREYVIGLSLVSTPANTDSTISLAFQVLSSQFGEHLQVESFFLHIDLYPVFVEDADGCLM